MSKYCGRCGHEAGESASYCGGCGKPFPRTSTAVVPHPDDVSVSGLQIQQSGPENPRDLIARDLAMLKQSFLENREEIRGDEMGWNLIRRRVSEYNVHVDTRELLEELEDLQRGAYLEEWQVRKEYHIKNLETLSKLRLAEAEMNEVVVMFARMLGFIERVVDQLPLSEDAKFEVAKTMLQEIVQTKVTGIVSTAEGTGFDISQLSLENREEALKQITRHEIKKMYED